MNGKPQTVSALTTASTDDVLAVLYVKADTANVGEIMRRMFARFDLPALCVFDPETKRIIGTTDTNTATAILAAWGTPTESILTPLTSMVLTLWDCDPDGLGVALVLANDFQKRSFYNVVNAGLGMFPFPASEPACMVNQNTGQIHFAYVDLSAIETLNSAGQTVCVEFSPPITKLTFE